MFVFASVSFGEYKECYLIYIYIREINNNNVLYLLRFIKISEFYEIIII